MLEALAIIVAVAVSYYIGYKNGTRTTTTRTIIHINKDELD